MTPKPEPKWTPDQDADPDLYLNFRDCEKADALVCGCVLAMRDELGRFGFNFCPIHAAAPDLLTALEAIKARINGEFSNASLLTYGPLSTTIADVLRISDAALSKV